MSIERTPMFFVSRRDLARLDVLHERLVEHLAEPETDGAADLLREIGDLLADVRAENELQWVATRAMTDYFDAKKNGIK